MSDNKILLNLNLLDSLSLDDVKHYMSKALLPYKNQVGIAEYKFFGLGERENLNNWKYDEFNYRINEYGFRIDELLADCDIGAFGCSYTFGQGLPIEMLWCDILSKQLKMSCQNYGVPGASLPSVLDIFCIVTKHVKIKKAIILLPSYNRIQIAKHNEKNELGILTCIPGNRSVYNQFFGLDEENIVRYIPDDEMIKQTKNSLYLAEYVAKSREIQLYVSSWDRNTYNLLENMNFTYLTLLPEWTSKQDCINDKARDNRHPGPKHHRNFSEIIIPYICK